MIEECPGMSSVDLDKYAESNTLVVERQIGFGIHGRVFSMRSEINQFRTAVKIFENETPFGRELAVYQRLQAQDVCRIGRFHVPLLVDFAPDLLLIRMTLVQRPFCLDFASAYLDELPDWFPPFDENWYREKEAQFGNENWPVILAAVRELQSLGIYQTDVSPSNIAL